MHKGKDIPEPVVTITTTKSVIVPISAKEVEAALLAFVKTKYPDLDWDKDNTFVQGFPLTKTDDDGYGSESTIFNGYQFTLREEVVEKRVDKL